MTFDYSSGYSPRACTRCKHLKRKCDKALPKCHSCNKSHFKCMYGYSTATVPVASTPTAEEFNTVVRTRESASLPTQPNLSPIYFLDYELYQRTITDFPRLAGSEQPDLQAFIVDIRDQSKAYFRSIHPWLPFISKKTFNERLLSPLTPKTTDITLLFASMKLVCSHPNGKDMRTSAYLMVKNAFFDAEMAGVLSIRVLQAWIILCLYEFGHAIYPSAYLSIGACARYAGALGLDLSGTDVQQASNWMEAEERTRALWAILIIDRFSSLGCPIRSFSIPDPEIGTTLPIDDTSWDEGILKNEQVRTLSTPPTTLMGRFGLMAMAVSLLGKTFRYVGDPANVVTPVSDELTILDRALAALAAVAREEGSNRGIGVCTPLVFCHTARILLSHHRRRCEGGNKKTDMDPENEIIRSGVAADVVRLSRWALSDSGHLYDEEICLLPLNAAYHTAIAFMEMNSKKRNEEYIQGLGCIKAFFRWYSQRWKVGEVYCQLIEAREALFADAMSL